MPPKRKLETLSWISILGTIFALLYLNNLLRNIVTYRQLTLGGKQEPLHDLLFCDWLRDYAPEKVVAYLTRDAIHILVGVWIFATILWWLIGTAGRGIPRTIMSPSGGGAPTFFGLTQLTIVPTHPRTATRTRTKRASSGSSPASPFTPVEICSGPRTCPVPHLCQGRP